jgi:HAD superfamily hydrolase (TIGR01509 family)
MDDFKMKAALFDFDGVVCDTEAQYSVFWGGVCRQYHPEQPGLENKIKGQTLDQIFDAHFSDMDVRKDIVRRLDEYEAAMDYEYVKGFLEFMKGLRRNGVATALVTSSNMKKMECVYRAHPDFKLMFDTVLTSDDFTQSKPHPQCFLVAANRLKVRPEDCVVFEDSFNGLKAGRAAGMTVVGVATTNTAQQIAPLCDIVVDDFSFLGLEACNMAMAKGE